MMRLRNFFLLPVCLMLVFASQTVLAADTSTGKPRLTISWANNLLQVKGDHLPGGELEIWYLEAYCRDGSTDRDWGKTVIKHETELVCANDDQTQVKLKSTLEDGVQVLHTITAHDDEIDFRVTATNPTKQASRAHWAQPCIRVGQFTGHTEPNDKYAYIKKCFVFIDGKLQLMPTPVWATKARYIPGQVWAAPGVPRNDVNPRPLNPQTPSNGIIGCFSADDKLILASVWEPYQELFQGVIRCVHSDFRIGGLKPGETKQIRGKLYLVENDLEALLKRYKKDFPEQQHRN